MNILNVTNLIDHKKAFQIERNDHLTIVNSHLGLCNEGKNQFSGHFWGLASAFVPISLWKLPSPKLIYCSSLMVWCMLFSFKGDNHLRIIIFIYIRKMSNYSQFYLIVYLFCLGTWIWETDWCCYSCIKFGIAHVKHSKGLKYE